MINASNKTTDQQAVLGNTPFKFLMRDRHADQRHLFQFRNDKPRTRGKLRTIGGFKREIDCHRVLVRNAPQCIRQHGRNRIHDARGRRGWDGKTDLMRLFPGAIGKLKSPSLFIGRKTRQCLTGMKCLRQILPQAVNERLHASAKR